MSFIDRNIFKTLDLYRINNGKKDGVLALGTFDWKLYNCCKQINNLQDELIFCKGHGVKLICFVCYNSSLVEKVSNLKVFDFKYYKLDILDKRIVKNATKMLEYIKFYCSSLQLNPIIINEYLVYDKPVMHFASGHSILWKPAFEDTLNSNNFKIINNNFLYEYKRDILLLVDLNKRHEASFIYERLAIDYMRNRVSLQYSNIINNSLIQCNCVHNGTDWIIKNKTITPVYGYKFEKADDLVGV